MSISAPAHCALIDRLRHHLKSEGYSASIQRTYPTLACQFLDYCDSKRLPTEAVRSAHVTEFLRRRYRSFRRRHAESLPLQEWRQRYTGAVHMLLRLVHGRWPVAEAPATAREAFHREIVGDYDTWLRDLRGLCSETRTKRKTHALRLLASLGPCAEQDSLARLSVRDVDAYLMQCCPRLRRASIEDYTVCLRDFLRHLYRSGAIASDISGTVIGPRIYEGRRQAVGAVFLGHATQVPH